MGAARGPESTRWTRAFGLLGLCLFAFSVTVADAAYRGRATAGRRIAGRGMGPRVADRFGVGRRLLSSSKLQDNGHCVTAYEHICRRRPELSELCRVVDSLPFIREKLQDPTKKFTLFCPTNEAIERLRAWEDWKAARASLLEAFGSTRRMRRYLLAYHAVPNRTLTSDELFDLRGDERFLEDYLNNVMPLFVENVDGTLVVSGLGSNASVVEGDIFACEAILHEVDHVLLPFDGDNALDEDQIDLLIEATNALRMRYRLAPMSTEEMESAKNADDIIDVLGVPIESVPTEWSALNTTTTDPPDYQDDEE